MLNPCMQLTAFAAGPAQLPVSTLVHIRCAAQHQSAATMSCVYRASAECEHDLDSHDACRDIWPIAMPQLQRKL